MVSVRSIVQIEIQNRVSTLFRRHSDGLSNGDGAISALFNQLSIIDFRSNFLPKRRTRRFRRWSRTMTATTWRPMGIPRRGQSVMCAARMWPARVCVGSLAIFGYVFILFWCTIQWWSTEKLVAQKRTSDSWDGPETNIIVHLSSLNKISACKGETIHSWIFCSRPSMCRVTSTAESISPPSGFSAKFRAQVG